MKIVNNNIGSSIRNDASYYKNKYILRWFTDLFYEKESLNRLYSVDCKWKFQILLNGLDKDRNQIHY